MVCRDGMCFVSERPGSASGLALAAAVGCGSSCGIAARAEGQVVHLPVPGRGPASSGYVGSQTGRSGRDSRTVRADRDLGPGNVRVRALSAVGEDCPQVRDRARSHTHSDNGHSTGYHYVMTGRRAAFPDGEYPIPTNELFPSLGSVVSRELGLKGSVPPYINMPHPMSAGGPGFYGAEHAPFVIESDPSQPDFEVRDLRPLAKVSPERFERRRRLLRGVEGDSCRAARWSGRRDGDVLRKGLQPDHLARSTAGLRYSRRARRRPRPLRPDSDRPMCLARAAARRSWLPFRRHRRARLGRALQLFSESERRSHSPRGPGVQRLGRRLGPARTAGQHAGRHDGRNGTHSTRQRTSWPRSLVDGANRVVRRRRHAARTRCSVRPTSTQRRSSRTPSV